MLSNANGRMLGLMALRAYFSVLTLLTFLATTVVAVAEESAGLKKEAHPSTTPALTIELNKLVPVNESCQVSFLMRNQLGTALELLTLELVLFNQAQQVHSLLLIKSEAMPVNKTSVRQYLLRDVGCDKISSFLINDIKACKGEGLSPPHCLKSLKLVSRTSARMDL